MRFANPALQNLMTNEVGEPIHVAERANLCLEARVSAARQAEYEAFVASRVDAPSAYWHDLREAHDAYVQQFVRGGNGKDSATFRPDETTLCQPGEDNQYVLRLENLNSLLAEEGFLDDRRPDLVQAQTEADRINGLIAARKQQIPQSRPKSVKGLAKPGPVDRSTLRRDSAKRRTGIAHRGTQCPPSGPPPQFRLLRRRVPRA